MAQPLHPKVTIRLFTDEKCFGPGVAALLIQIREHRSLRAAAQAMDMAYSKAWRILKQAEAGLETKLVCSTTGGKGGGGAHLTEEGEVILQASLDYAAEVESFAVKQFEIRFGSRKIAKKAEP